MWSARVITHQCVSNMLIAPANHQAYVLAVVHFAACKTHTISSLVYKGKSFMLCVLFI